MAHTHLLYCMSSDMMPKLAYSFDIPYATQRSYKTLWVAWDIRNITVTHMTALGT